MKEHGQSPPVSYFERRQIGRVVVTEATDVVKLDTDKPLSEPSLAFLLDPTGVNRPEDDVCQDTTRMGAHRIKHAVVAGTGTVRKTAHVCADGGPDP